MDETRKEMIEDCRVYISTEVSIKQEPLDEDDYSDAKYPVVQNRTEGRHVQGLSREICVKQELLTACKGEAHVMSIATLKTKDMADSTHVDDVRQGASGSSLCKVKTEPVTQQEKDTTDVPGPECKETLFPVALYQHEQIQPVGGMTSYRKIAPKGGVPIATCSREITSDYTYRCSICDFNSIYKKNLATHLKTHTGEKPYKCSVCDYVSAYKQSIVNHTRRHTGEKPYKCTICRYSSIQKYALALHMKTHNGERLCMRRHTGEKPYKCSECDFVSAYKQTLVKHMRRHVEEKPYKCSICGYNSIQKYNLVLHMKKSHTGEEPC